MKGLLLALLVAVVALAVADDEAHRQRILTMACLVQTEEAVPRTLIQSECPDNAKCSLGPLEHIYFPDQGVNVRANFCNVTLDHPSMRNSPCRVMRGERIIRERACSRGTCTKGPRMFTYSGRQLVSYFCTERE